VNVFNHCSTYFADVVWEGLSTRHIRTSLNLDLSRTTTMLDAHQPPYYMDAGRLDKNPLFIYTATTLRFPRFSEQVIAHARTGGPPQAVVLPCDTTRWPIAVQVSRRYHICKFLKRNL